MELESFSSYHVNHILVCIMYFSLCFVPHLGFLLGHFLGGFLETFWKWLSFSHPAHVFPESGHILAHLLCYSIESLVDTL